jgi:hypothetical protein
MKFDYGDFITAIGIGGLTGAVFGAIYLLVEAAFLGPYGRSEMTDADRAEMAETGLRDMTWVGEDGIELRVKGKTMEWPPNHDS